MTGHHRLLCPLAVAVMLAAGGTSCAAARAPASEMARAETACHAHNQKVRGLEAQGLSEEQLKPERDAYERACARLESLRGNLQSAPAPAEVAAFEANQPPISAREDCAQKQ